MNNPLLETVIDMYGGVDILLEELTIISEASAFDKQRKKTKSAEKKLDRDYQKLEKLRNLNDKSSQHLVQKYEKRVNRRFKKYSNRINTLKDYISGKYNKNGKITGNIAKNQGKYYKDKDGVDFDIERLTKYKDYESKFNPLNIKKRKTAERLSYLNGN